MFTVTPTLTVYTARTLPDPRVHIITQTPAGDVLALCERGGDTWVEWPVDRRRPCRVCLGSYLAAFGLGGPNRAINEWLGSLAA